MSIVKRIAKCECGEEFEEHGFIFKGNILNGPWRYLKCIDHDATYNKDASVSVYFERVVECAKCYKELTKETKSINVYPEKEKQNVS